MALLLLILKWTAIIIGSLLGLLLIALVTFVACGLRQVWKIQFGLPWLRWLTLDEAVALGLSRFWCRVILPSLHEAGALEFRLRSDVLIPEPLQEVPERLGFVVEPEFYEFKLTKRGGRRRRWSSQDLFAALPGAFKPA